MVDSDDHMRITRRAWLANGWPEEQFDARRAQNTVFCSRIAERVLKYDYVIQRYTVLTGKVPAFAERYSKMRKQLKRTQAFSTVFNILGIGATALIPGASLAYVGLVGANAASGEVRGRTSTKGQLLNNDHGEFTLELDDLHIETAIMSAEEHQDYLAMMVNTCANSKFN